jgi:hypothetical protein
VNGNGVFDSWLPRRELESLFAAGRTLLPSMPVTPSSMLSTIVQTAAERMVGQRLTVRSGVSDVDLTLTEVDCQVDSIGLGQARIGDLRLVAEDIDVPETPLERLTVLCRDVSLTSLPLPALAAGEVEVSAVVSAEVVCARIAELRPDVVVEFAPDRTLRLRTARGLRWGSLRVTVEVADGEVLLRPAALHAGPVSVPLPRRMRPFTITVPELPRGLRLTGVEVGDGELVLHGIADRWRERLSSVPLSTLLGWVSTTATTLTVPKLPKRPDESTSDGPEAFAG